MIPYPIEASPREAREHEAIDALIRLMREHHRLAELRSEALGIHRSQHHMLVMLARMGESVSQKRLADALGISAAAATRTLKALEAEGLIERVDGADGRQNAVRVLPAGRNKLDETRQHFAALDRAMFKDVGDDEIDALLSLLRRLRDNLKQTEGAE